MADSKLTQIFTTDPSKLLEGYDKILRKTEGVLESSRQLARESRRQSSDAAKGLEDQAAGSQRAISGLAGMAAGYLSVREALQLVNSEIQQQIELQSKAGQAQRRLANPTASMAQNLGDIPAAELRDVKKKIDEMAIAGLGERGALRSAFGELASASPTYANRERLETLEVAAKFAPQPDQLPTIAAGLADTAGLTGSKNPLENLGVLAATAARSRGTQPSMIAEHIIPAAKNLLSYGNTVPQALALPVAIQNSIVDVEGRVSGTAAMGLAEQLKQFFTAENVRERVSKEIQREGNLGEFDRPNAAVRTRLTGFLSAEGVKSRNFEDAFEHLKRSPDLQEKFFSAEIERRAAGAETTDAQIAMLQRDREQAEEFIKGFTGERKPLEQIRNLLRDSSSDIAKQYALFREEGIPAGEAAAELGRKQIGNIQSEPSVASQRLSLAAENASDKILTDNFRQGTAGAIREGLKQALEAANTRTVERKALVEGVFGYDAFNQMLAKGMHPAEAARRILETRAERLEDPMRRETPFIGAQLYSEAAPRSQEELAAAKMLRGLAASLVEIKADLDAGVAAEGGAPLERRNSARSQLDEAGSPQARPQGAAQAIDFDVAGIRYKDLERYDLADEFDMLKAGRPAAEFTGEHGDLEGLGNFVAGQVQHVKETGGDSAALAVLEQIRDKIDATEKQLAELNKSTAAAAGESRAANRSAGARAAVGSGRE